MVAGERRPSPDAEQAMGGLMAGIEEGGEEKPQSSSSSSSDPKKAGGGGKSIHPAFYIA